MAVRLCRIAAEIWPLLDAAYVASPVPLMKMAPHRFANMVYAWCVERLPGDKLDDWLTEMNELLEWQDTESEAAVNLESESFLAAMAKGGG